LENERNVALALSIPGLWWVWYLLSKEFHKSYGRLALLISSDGIGCNHLRICGWCLCSAHTRIV